MHTRALRALELSRSVPRRVINLTQKHGVNADIRAVPSDSIPANQVVTGWTYQHAGGGGGLDLVSLGINATRLSGTLAVQPFLDAPLAPPFGHSGVADAWLNHDKQMNHTLPRQNTPLRHGPGFLHHIWQGSSFAGSCSTTSLRSATDADALPVLATRPLPRTAPTPVAPTAGAAPVAAPAVSAGPTRSRAARVTLGSGTYYSLPINRTPRKPLDVQPWVIQYVRR